MNLLGIETTSAFCEVSLMKGSEYSYITIQEGLVHSEWLIGMIDALLLTHRITKHDLNGIVVDKGPGSFTGIRVGVSVARGFAQGLRIQIAPICGLDALAEQCAESLDYQKNCIICPVIDALRGEVYTALYEIDGTLLTRITDYHIANATQIAAYASDAAAQHKMLVWCGDERVSSMLNAHHHEAVSFIPSSKETYLGDTLIRLGERMFREQKGFKVNDVVPLYIRKSAAESAFQKKQI